MIVVIGEIQKVLFQCLQCALADERHGHVEILTALQLVFDGAFHGPTVMIGDQHRFVCGIRVVVFVYETGKQRIDE